MAIRTPAARRASRLLKNLSLAAALAVACAPLAGCTLVGALAYKTSGGVTIDARFVPPKEPTLVLVGSRENPAAFVRESDALSNNVVAQLQQHAVVPVVGQTESADLRSARPTTYAKMTPAAVGRSVGARQVIYVDVDEFSAEPALGSELFKGKVQVHVSVFDARTGQALWPADNAAGYPLEIETPYGGNADADPAAALRQRLTERMADRIAKLFYKWQNEESVDGTEPTD